MDGRTIWIKGFLVRGRGLNLPKGAQMGELVRTRWCVTQDGEWEYQRGKRLAHSQRKLGDGEKRERISKPGPGALPCMAPPVGTPHRWSTIYAIHTFLFFFFSPLSILLFTAEVSNNVLRNIWPTRKSKDSIPRATWWTSWRVTEYPQFSACNSSYPPHPHPSTKPLNCQNIRV